MKKATTRKSSRAKTPKEKNFVLDTNVLIHDPWSMDNFDDNNVFIPVEVIEELDRFKSETTTRGHHAREVHRQLDGIFPNQDALKKGCRKNQGGRIRVVINEYLQRSNPTAASRGLKRMQSIFPDIIKPDNRIIASAIYVAEKYPARKTVIVTKDMNMRLKARMLGFEAEDYLNDKAHDEDLEPIDYDKFFLTTNELQRFCSRSTLNLPAKRIEELVIGYYLLENEQTGATKPAKYIGNGTFRTLQFPETMIIKSGQPMKPRNLGQQFLLDAIFDESVSLVTVCGKAGTGKTILSVAAGLYLAQRGYYEKLMVTRSVIPMGRDIGFLPGTMEEKMRPWVQPIYDAIEAITTRVKDEQFQDKPQKKKNKHANGHDQQHDKRREYERLIDSGMLEIEALAQIRGRSIPRSFFILDEAQNMTPHEAKTITTRMSERSKLIMIGDPSQIDNPYVDRWSNGLVYTRNKLKNQNLTAHINLIKGERSDIAELAANVM
ncbi:MAG: PhoH family protein [Verrucomicrobiota bacterium]